MRVLLLAAVLTAGCFSATQPRDDPLLLTREAAILWSVPYPKLLVEVDYLPGSPPSTFALDNLAAVAKAQTLKREVRVLPPVEIADEGLRRKGESWTLEEIYRVHEATFSSGAPWRLGQGDTAFLHVIYLDSLLEYEYNGKSTAAVGLSSRNVIYVFRSDAVLDDGPLREVRDPRSGTPMQQVRETGTLLHELGHAMGLVNNGIPMVRPHNDPEDPAHSRNPESIMSGGWDIVSEFRMRAARGDEPSLRFDDDDLADLEAFRNRQPAAPRSR